MGEVIIESYTCAACGELVNPVAENMPSPDIIIRPCGHDRAPVKANLRGTLTRCETQVGDQTSGV